MPNFTPDGPDIPVDVLQALEEGELVFFCGAGVSKPAGLPLFGELVDAVYACLHEDMTDLEKKVSENGEYDRVLTLLERRVDAIQVRSAIAAIFAREFNENLEIHRDLLRLSKTPAGPHRLVTTNFDDLFQRAGAAENHIDAAPRLRSPKPAWWHTVVHLHGRLADQTDPTHSHLVLTSEDFGQAYMLDGWATRFVVELFRNFTVVFIGYSLNDPVMRYLVDALAAARSRGEAFKPCYAFAAFEGETTSHIETEWAAKGVTAIVYKTSPTHHHLYETLKELADLHDEGFTSKQRLALQYADSPPVDAHDPIGQRVTWALSDPSGKVAQTFASMDPVPPFGWLRHLEAAGLLGLTDQRSVGKRNLLATQSVGTVADRLSDVTLHLARWLARHVHNPELARWVIANGCVLHPAFRQFVHSQLKLLKVDNELCSDLREFWSLIASEPFVSLLIRYYQGWYVPEFFDIDSSIANAHRVAELLRLVPVLSYYDFQWDQVFGDSPTVGDEENGNVALIWHAVNLELKLLSGDASFVVIEKAQRDQDLLVELVPRLTQNLIEAWDWRLAFHKIERHEDYSYIDLASISPHPQNHSFQDWSKLVELVRDGFILLAARDLERARVIAEFWREANYPIFHRLYLYSMAEVDGIARSSDVIIYLKRYSHLMFAPSCGREMLRFFRKRGSILSKRATEWICAQILKGLDRTLYLPMSDEEWERMNGWQVWKRLAKLALGGAPLPPRAKAELERLQVQYDWMPAPNNQDEFPAWHEEGWIDEEAALPIEAIRHKMSRELIALVMHPPNEPVTRRTRDQYAAFGKLLQEQPSKVVRVLLQLALSGECPSRFVSQTLGGFRGEALGRLHRSHWRYAGLALTAIGDNCLAECALDASRWLQSATPDHITAIGEEAWWELWDRLWSISQRVPQSTQDDKIDRWVGLAINHPGGVLAETLLSRLWSLGFRIESGIPNEFVQRFDSMISDDTIVHQLARVILASRLPQLFQLDQHWTVKKLIPLMHIGSKEETPGLWQGYLWAPRLPPDLLMVIKGPFLDAFVNSSSLGDDYGRNLRRLFTSACLEIPHSFSDAEVQSSLRALSADELADAVRALSNHLKQVAERAEEQWTRRVHPFIDRYWPLDNAHKSPAVSAAFLDLVLKTGNAFPSAVAATKKFLTAIHRPHTLISQLRRDSSHFIAAFPEAILELLDLTIPQSDGSHYGLREVLDRLLAVRPDFRTDRRLQQLERVA